MKKFLSTILFVAMIVTLLPATAGSAAAAIPGAEMLPDPDMELGTTGWSDYVSNASEKITYATDEAHSGNQSICAVHGSWFTTPRYDFDNNKVYEFSVWVKGTGRYFIGVPCYDKNGNALSDYAGWSSPSYGPNYILEDKVSYGDWQKKTITISAGGLVPDDTAYFRVSIRALAPSGSSDTASVKLWFDDASLVAYDVEDLDTKGMINPSATMGAPYWWSFLNAEYDYNEYHSAPHSAKTAYNNDTYIAVRETYDSAYKLDPGKLYELSVWVKTDTATNATFRMTMNTTDVYVPVSTINPTTEWTQYKTTFYPGDVDPKASASTKWKIVAEMRAGGTAGNIWIDDIVLKEAKNDYEGNLLQDPTFDSSLEYDGYWRIQRGNFVTTENHGESQGGCARLSFTYTNGTDVTETSVNLMGFAKTVTSATPNYAVLEEGKEYELTFWAKGSQGSNSVFRLLLGTADNEFVLGKGEKIYPTTEWKEYKYLIDVGALKTYFDEGADIDYTPYFSIWQSDGFEGELFIDDITLYEVAHGYTNSDLSVNMTKVAVETTEGSTNVHGKAYFNTAIDEIDVIAAVYDQNGILKECVAKAVKDIAAGHNAFTVALDNPVEANDTVKLFAFEAASSLKPVKENGTEVVAAFPARILGRYENVDGVYSLNWPNSGVEFTFKGTQASIYFDKVTGTSYFTPIVDGVAADRVLAKQGWTTIASGLSNEEHTIKFVRSSEASGGRTWASAISANEAAPTAEKERLIEFYGDSYTAGYGNLGVDGSGWGNPDNTDAQKAYSSVIANYFNADANLIAYSGKGIIKNGSDNKGINMTQMASLADIMVNGDTATPPEWNFTKHTPDLVVVFLGTNDYGYSSAIGEEFKTAYLGFIEDIRERYGDVKILCLSKSAKSYGDEVKNVVETLNADGDENIIFYQFATFGTSGVLGHPNVAEAAAVAECLKQPIEDFMNW